MNKLWMELQKLTINESIEDKGILKACFMGGTPGAGKTYVLTKIKSGQIEPRIVNTDKMLEFMTKSMGIDINTAMRDWYAYAEKTKTLSKNQLSLYLNSMLPIIIDSTSSNPPSVFRRQGILKSIGYDVAFIWVDTSLETALKRNRQRERNVPEDFLERAHKRIQELRPYYKSEFNNFFEIKNDEGELNDDAILSAFRKVNSFFNSDVKNPIGSSLIEDMRAAGYKYLIDTDEFDMPYLKSLVSNWYKK